MSSEPDPHSDADVTDADVTDADVTDADVTDADVTDADSSVERSDDARAASTHSEPRLCPNCGTTSPGRFCPQCGERVGEEPSLLEIASTLVQEIVDLEGGFWPTARDLTLNPGRMLRTYLGGARSRYMSPGRYLLTSMLLVALMGYGLQVSASGWAVPDVGGTGLIERGVQERVDPAGADPARVDAAPADTGATGGDDGRAEEADSEEKTLPEDLAVFELPGDIRSVDRQTVALVMSCLLAGLAAISYRQLFPEIVHTSTAALAVALFIWAHIPLLVTSLRAISSIVLWGWSGSFQVVNFPLGIQLLATIAFSGIAFYGGSGRSLRRGAKGVLAAVWALVDSLGVFAIAYAAWIGVQLVTHPLSSDARIMGSLLGLILFGAGATLFSLHAAVYLWRRRTS